MNQRLSGHETTASRITVMGDPAPCLAYVCRAPVASPQGFTDSSSDHLDDFSIVSVVDIGREFWARP
jgi:hypothetical protein